MPDGPGRLASFYYFAYRAVVERLGATRARHHADDLVHLDAAVGFLRRSIRASDVGGSCHSYLILTGWRPAYPETTGYILKTFFRLADAGYCDTNRRVARELADWLLGIQLPGGGIEGLDLGRSAGANVFNTGMVMLGWNEAFRRLGDERYLDASVAAGDFLLDCLDDEGCFSRHTSYGLAHAYNVRAAWALLELGRIAGSDRHVEGALANIAWTLGQQQENGFFRRNAFRPGRNANTHAIGYVASGLIEAFALTGDKRCLAAVEATTDQIVDIYRRRGELVAEFGEAWDARSRHVCLVGKCQLAIVMMQLYQTGRNQLYLDTARQLIEDVKSLQALEHPSWPIHGGIPGSFPIYGRYAPLQFPNWATKFFVDALLMKVDLEPRITERAAAAPPRRAAPTSARGREVSSETARGRVP